jgi:hypothetical protein
MRTILLRRNLTRNGQRSTFLQPMAISSVDVIGPAFERMKNQLFSPFRFGQWVKLAFVGFLAGEMGGAGGCQGNIPMDLLKREPDSFQSTAPLLAGGLLVLLAVALAVLTGFALLVLLTYISSRMRFVLFDSVLAGECRIGEFWRRRGSEAWRLFVFHLLFGLASIVTFAVLFGIPFLFVFSMGWLQAPREHLVPLIGIGVLAFFVFFFVAIGFAIFYVLTKDFVVPMMAFENISAGEGWNRLLEMMKAEKGKYAGYIGMKIALAIAATIITGIVMLILFLIVLIPVGGAGALAFIWGRNAGVGWTPATIALAIVVGVAVILILIALAALVSVPVMVFFPSYAMYFFADRYPPLRSALFPAPASP